ncbi:MULTISPECIES: 6-phospho-3-hexuloisomerase [Bacillus]|uniref:6-phospho 3-hexuloisomerase n=2 Tax=Bacillus TaxID=1386 RepID=A0A0M4FSV8_9BACI|nr:MULTISPECIES: 6-phospho-3-hexuloisomerase [Bacillus]ALC82985.1 6-phospho 3-hexuloisomerase [Bacillus gobiensis]MBP1081997.1 6-phospho-3-hexuloisomerase [Bacillus capparidis]MED1096632.1 6-phospho-3-hexuloisomerase [Bacillus capparidis]
METLDRIIEEIKFVSGKIDKLQIEKMADLLARSERIFVIGEGRSGLMAKSFAMRLMHLGATVYVVGETITPSIEKNDVLVAVSGSGTTKSVVWTAEKARSLGCFVAAITTDPESELASYSSLTLQIPAATKYRRENELKTIQPLGSLFDQCAHIAFDTVCLEYGRKNEVGHDQAFQKHSNME